MMMTLTHYNHLPFHLSPFTLPIITLGIAFCNGNPLCSVLYYLKSLLSALTSLISLVYAFTDPCTWSLVPFIVHHTISTEYILCTFLFCGFSPATGQQWQQKKKERNCEKTRR